MNPKDHTLKKNHINMIYQDPKNKDIPGKAPTWIPGWKKPQKFRILKPMIIHDIPWKLSTWRPGFSKWSLNQWFNIIFQESTHLDTRIQQNSQWLGSEPMIHQDISGKAPTWIPGSNKIKRGSNTMKLTFFEHPEPRIIEKHSDSRHS